MKLTLSLFVAMAAVMGCSAKGKCLCPPFFVPFQESCYRPFGTKLNWQAAENACKRIFNEDATAHLVSITSEDEKRFVYELWKSATGNMVAGADITFWIGLTDKVHERKWVWTDGSQVSYTNWKPRQPDNYHNNEDCVHQSTVGPDLPSWNDLNCRNRAYYMCELPQTKC